MLRNYASVGLIAVALGSWLTLGDIGQATAQKGGGGGGRGGGGGGGARGGGGISGGGGARGGGGISGGGGSVRSAPSIRSGPSTFSGSGTPRGPANIGNSFNAGNINRSANPNWNNSRYHNSYYYGNHGYNYGNHGYYYGNYHHHHNDFWRYFAYAAVADWVGFHPYGWWGPYYGYWGQYPYTWYPDVLYDRGIAQAGYAERSNGTALIEVLLPTEDARVWIDGNGTASRGTERSYTSPTLEVGHNYSYTIKASWITEDGELATVERLVPLSAGSRVLVDFTRSPLQRPTTTANKE